MKANQVLRACMCTIGLASLWLLAGPAQAQDSGGSNCCEEHETPGCDNPDCESAVCAGDDFCCTIAWDSGCVDDAVMLCGDCEQCGSGVAGSCCEANGTPYCNVAECCEMVCEIDPFCCNTSWDAICAFEARRDCFACPAGPECGDLDAGDCCQVNSTPSCDDSECCETICAQDPYCCTFQWDDLCVEQAGNLCESCFECGSNGAGNCCSANGTSHCANPECCEIVCDQQPFCCEVGWDAACAEDANQLCEICQICGTPQAGNCCGPNGSPACNDPACCEAVCNADPFCCDTQWDFVCAFEAFLESDCNCGQ